MNRIVFIGSSKFGLKVLEKTLSMGGIKVAGIITAPKKFEISYSTKPVNNILHADFKKIADKYNIPLQEIKTNMKDKKLFKVMIGWKPEYFLVAGWYHMIPKEWREVAPAYGLHASLLPLYRGAVSYTHLTLPTKA